MLLYLILIILDLTSSDHNEPGENSPSGKIGYLPNLDSSINLYFLTILTMIALKCFERGSYFSRSDRPYFYALWRSFRLCLRWAGVLTVMTVYLFSLNMILLIVCNTSILNPGPSDKPLSVFYNNIQGLINTRDLASDKPPLNMTKIHELHGYLYTNKPDLVILNETWLKKSILDSEILPSGYKVFRLDRSSRSHPWDPDQPKKFRMNGGGVLIAHRDDLNISSTKVIVAKAQAELLSVVLKLPTGRKMCISTFYRVGTLGNDNFQEFANYFRALALKKKIDKHILIGDMNLNYVSWPEGDTTCALQSSFLDFLMGDLGHAQLITNPTHKAGNVLDLLFTNVPSIINNIKILDRNEACLSDHFGITMRINLNVSRKKTPKRKVYNYTKANWSGLNFALRRVNWDSVVGSQDPHTAWPRFRDVLAKLCNEYIPKKNVRCQFQPPWYDSDCDKVLRDKEKWRKKAKEPGNESALKKFRQLRSDFKCIMNDKMRLSVEDDSDSALISKKFWKHVKLKSKSTRIPETVRYGDRFRNKPVEQASLFNEYFYQQFSEASSYDIDVDMGAGPNNTFMDIRFHVLDVFFILKGINPGKAAGPDGIHGIVLKNCANSLSKPLTMIFNTSFVTGCLPEEWKLASVVPVHKKGDKGSVENYRPISLTCLAMKVFERCIRKELFAACEGLIDAGQHGFVSGKSCTTQMVPFTDNLALALNNRSRSDIVYFDFAKAFDSVSHDLILRKLKNLFCIDGLMLRFIKSYLQGRRQQVIIGGAVSSTLPVQSGVPQGSILGPLLFVLFINDMFSCISEGTNIALYADDTKIWRVIDSFEDHFILQGDIDKLYAWSIGNKMTFHPSKTKVLSVTMQRNVFDILPFNIFWYKLNEVMIDYVSSHTDLGVVITNRLLWGEHCNQLVSKASSKLGLLMRTCHFTTDKRQKRAFYLSIVRSIFEHCSIIWCPQTVTHLAKFEAIQKRAIKWINGQQFDRYNDIIFFEKQKELKILPIRFKFIHNSLTLFYKIINNLVCISLPSYLSVAEAGRMRYTRSTAPVIEGHDTSTYCCSIVSNCDSFRNSFFPRTMLLWNALPASVRQEVRISVFKSKLTAFLWSANTSWPD